MGHTESEIKAFHDNMLYNIMTVSNHHHPTPLHRWRTSGLQGHIVIFMNVSNEQGISRKTLFPYDPCDVVVWFGSTRACHDKYVTL